MPDEAARQRFLAELEQMRRDYAARLPERADALEALRASIRAGGDQGLRRVQEIVHRLAGTAGSYGLVDISLVATELELRIKEGAAPAALEADLDRLTSLLRGQSPPAATAPPSGPGSAGNSK